MTIKGIETEKLWSGRCTMIKLLTLVLIDSKLKVACGAADVRRGKGEEGTDGRLQSGGEHSLTLTIGTL